MILIASTQYPCYGGAATNTYALIKYLRSKNVNVVGVFLEDNMYVNVDPNNLKNVVKIKTLPFIRDKFEIINRYRDSINKICNCEPKIILCKNYLAPICMKKMYPKSKIIFLVSGLCVMSKTDQERTAVEISDLIVVNSDLTMKLFIKTYPDYLNKLYTQIIDTSKYISVLINDNVIEKKYDFIIACSILTRPEKNNEFLIDLLKKNVFDKYSKMIIGNDNKKFLTIQNSIVHNLMSHDNLMNIMKSCRVLLYPSLYDSNPNTIREAIINKCLVLTTNNVGFYEKLPDISVCYSYEHEEWIKKSTYLIDNYDKIIKNYNINYGDDDEFYNFTQTISFDIFN